MISLSSTSSVSIFSFILRLAKFAPGKEPPEIAEFKYGCFPPIAGLKTLPSVN